MSFDSFDGHLIEKNFSIFISIGRPGRFWKYHVFSFVVIDRQFIKAKPVKKFGDIMIHIFIQKFVRFSSDDQSGVVCIKNRVTMIETFKTIIYIDYFLILKGGDKIILRLFNDKYSDLNNYNVENKTCVYRIQSRCSDFSLQHT